MSVTYLGTRTVQTACLAIGLALPALGASLADLTKQIASFEEQLTLNLGTLASPPDPVTQAAAIAEAATGMLASLATLPLAFLEALPTANLTLTSSISTLLGFKSIVEAIQNQFVAAASTGGIHLLAVDSTPAAVGSELASAIAGPIPAGRIQGVILLTQEPAAFETLSKFIATS